MAEIVVMVELPIGSAHDVDTTELVLLLRDIKPANIIDYVDASEMGINNVGQEQNIYDG